MNIDQIAARGRISAGRKNTKKMGIPLEDLESMLTKALARRWGAEPRNFELTWRIKGGVLLGVDVSAYIDRREGEP